MAKLRSRWPAEDLPLTGDVNEKAARAGTVVVATPWDSAAPTVAALSELLEGKVVVSMANALARVGTEFHALVPPRGSVAMDIQAAAPGARVAAAFHHLPARELADLKAVLAADVLVCADDPLAADRAAQLVSRVPGLRPLVAGSLASASAVEAFTAVLLNLNTRYKTHASLRVTGIGEDAP